MKKRRIDARELHEKLQQAFAAKAGDLCIACRLPMPVYFAGAKDGPNWRLPPLDECSSLCHTLVQDLAAEFARRYELPPGG